MIKYTNEPKLIKKGSVITTKFDGRFIEEKYYKIMMEIIESIHSSNINKYIEDYLFKN